MLVNVLFSFFFIGMDLILLERESVSESWIGKVVVVSLKTFVNVLFYRNRSLGLEDSRTLLERESVSESWVGRVMIVSLKTFVNVLFCRNRSLELEDFWILLEMKLIDEFFQV